MEQEQKRPAARYKPGELDRTRQNIGEIDRDEAAKMTKVLGGEIGVEKSAPADSSAMPKRRREYIKKVQRSDKGTNRPAPSETFSAAAVSAGKSKGYGLGTVLPEPSGKEKLLMDKLMMSAEYKIKPNYGIFNFLLLLTRGHGEGVVSSFVTVSLKNHITHIKNFSSGIASMLSWSSESYRTRVMQEKELRYMYFKTVSAWPCQELAQMYEDLSSGNREVTIPMLVPIVRLIYRCILPLTYLGEERTAALIAEMSEEIGKINSGQMSRLKNISKNILGEWRYLTGVTCKGLYPLLMRMCSPTFVPYPEFFRERISKILPFLNMTRYDLFLPEKKEELAVPEKTKGQRKTESEPFQKEKGEVEEEGKEKALASAEDKKDKAQRSGDFSSQQVIKMGLILLDRMFPQAGWLELPKMPDLYPYFQPLYRFPDGFNLLANTNPLQAVVVLLRILEDLFQGCRNIHFDLDQVPDLLNEDDSLSSVLGDIGLYREVLFERRYAADLARYANMIYSQKDFGIGQFGKKLMTDILSKTRFYFLPYFEFQPLILDKTANDSPYRPLSLRIHYAKIVFTELTEQIQNAAAGKEPVPAVENVWEPYEFGIPNVVSARLDVLLGAKRKNGKATNASLIRYTLGVIAVLDWWISDKMSPAYKCAGRIPYRVSPEDGDPLFSVPVRNDQDKVFMQNIKSLMQKNTAKSEKVQA